MLSSVTSLVFCLTLGWQYKGRAAFLDRQHVIRPQVPQRGAYSKRCSCCQQCPLTTACVCVVEGDVPLHALAVNVGLKCPEGPQACGWAPRCAGRAPGSDSWRSAQRQRENHDWQQLRLSHTSKRSDRMHKSTVAVQIRAEHGSVSQTATPKVMRGQNLDASCFLYRSVNQQGR